MTFSRNTRLGLLGLAVSAIAIYFVLSQIQLDLFAQSLRNGNYVYLIPCLIFLVLGLFTRAVRWRILLGNAVPFWRAFSIMNVAYLVNGVLPLRLGEVVRMYLASRIEGNPVPLMKSAGTILVERLLDLLAVVLMVFISLAFAPVPDVLRVAGLFGAVSAIGGFVIAVFLARQRAILHRLLAKFATLIPQIQVILPKIEHALDHFLDGLLPLTKPRIFFSVVNWTLLSWLLSIIAGYWLMFTLFEQGDWTATMLYIAAAAFAIAVPAVPGNLGTYEGSIWVALSAIGYSNSNQITAFAVLVHAINVFVHASTGVLGFIQEGISLNQLQQGVSQMQQLEG